jgi:hypothetical protein
MLEEFCFAFARVQIQLTLFVIKTVLIVMSQQIFNQKPLIDHL